MHATCPNLLVGYSVLLTLHLFTITFFLNCIIIYLFTAEKQNMLCVLLSSVVIVLCFKSTVDLNTSLCSL